MSVFNCEGRFWYKKPFFNETRGDFTRTKYSMYWCRGAPCAERNDNINKDAPIELWTINEIADVLGTTVNEDILSLFAGWVNRMNVIFTRLHCRECNAVLRPEPFEAKRLGFYAVPLFFCMNSDCKEFEKTIRITHCLNGNCHDENETIIDSRDCPQCSNNWLVCQDCLACCKQHHTEKRVSCRTCGNLIGTQQSSCASCGFELLPEVEEALNTFWEKAISTEDIRKDESKEILPF